MIDKQIELLMDKQPIRLIGLSGLAGAGKSIVAEMICNELDPFVVKSFSAKLKEVAAVLTGIPAKTWELRSMKEAEMGEWGMTGRLFLQKLGTDAIRNGLDQNTWVRALFSDFDSRKVYTFLDKNDVLYADDIQRWVICDARFLNELQEIKRRGGICIRIDRPSLNSADGHISENEWRDFKFDAVLENKGTLEELKDKVKTLLSEVGLVTPINV